MALSRRRSTSLAGSCCLLWRLTFCVALCGFVVIPKVADPWKGSAATGYRLPRRLQFLQHPVLTHKEKGED